MLPVPWLRPLLHWGTRREEQGMNPAFEAPASVFNLLIRGANWTG